MSTRALIGLFLAATAGVVIFLFVSMSSGPEGGVEVGARSAAACTKGSANCLPALTWIDTNGTRLTADSLAGKVVVVNFWATWCKPCQKEIPAFSRVAERYKGRAVILGVLTSDNPDAETLLNYMSDYEMSYSVVRADKDILFAFHYPSQFPTTFVFDGQGRRVQAHLGPMTEDQLAAQIDQLLHAP